jgi:hypothetical protein
MNWKRFAALAFALVAVVLFSYQPAFAQSTISTGSIQGVVTDPQGGSIPNVTVKIIGKDNGRTVEATTNSAGAYNSGALTPGVYTLQVGAPNFKTMQDSITVQVGVISSGNLKLELGSATTIVEVTGQTVAVNTDQAQVQGVLTSQQIENLPINGRNFLDLAQLEPGVQIQDGANFDPTKTGFSSISFGGRFGRTARIEIDGVDVSDETVGTTTTSIPASAISEFQLAQSGLDLTNELTSSGAVNVVTKSGTNNIHGEAYGLFRTSTQAATFPGDGTFQRTQSGGNVGGPVIKNKLFFFADGEYTIQHAGAGVTPAAPFDSFAGNFPSPFKEGNLLGRLDYQVSKNFHLFSRFSYFSNFLIPAFGAPSFSFFANKDITRNTMVGGDFTTGSFTHSIRFEYLNFRNQIADAVRGSGEPFADFPTAIQFLGGGNLSTGPSADAPQTTPQTSHQVKYDGSKIVGTHIFRYGVAYNHIQGGGFAKFFNVAPLALNFQQCVPLTVAPVTYDPSCTTGGVLNTYSSFDTTAGLVCPGGQTGISCPLNYKPDEPIIGNGQGFASEKAALGFPFGGLGPDNRFAFYVGDSWKIYPNFTLTYGVRYVHDTGRTDSDVPAIPELNAVFPGFGDKVKNPNHNFGPQLGIAYDPFKNGKTVIRAGVGIYYENAIFNNVLFDRSPRLRTGSFFFADSAACLNGVARNVQFADGTVQKVPGANTTCNTALGSPVPAAAVGPTCAAADSVAQCIVNFQNAYQAAAEANLANPNKNFIGTQIEKGLPLSSIFFPDYKSPRSVQINIGIQRELRPGMVLTADYLRNIGTQFLLSVDSNHTGDASILNIGAANAAVAATLAQCGAASINTAAAPGGCAGLHPAMGGSPAGAATIADFASNGLDSPADEGVGACNGPHGIGAACAFGGTNPNVGPTAFLFPAARSVYNAFDLKLVQNASHPLPGIKYVNFQFSYTYSRFVNTSSSNGLGAPGTPENSDQDFIDASLDNRNPGRFTGPNSLDRTHQFNFGGYLDLPLGFRVGLVSHFWSPLAVTPTLNTGVNPGSIFQTDFTGDGTVDDPLARAQTDGNCGAVGGSCNIVTYKAGAYGRSLGPGSLTTAINTYNTNIAGQVITPAGQALVNCQAACGGGGFTMANLIALGATPPAVAAPPNGQVPLSWLKATDMQLSWVGHFWHERLTFTPSVGFYNVFNFANFDPAGNTLSGALSGGAGSINGTTAADRANRIGNGSGVYGLGAPRVIEWGLKLQF